ncbi:MAG: hypothetical protein O7G85_17670, partial [Planctomycetota bacterium]|nr:hypothetical protein [Planctomycetota bacterium]
MFNPSFSSLRGAESRILIRSFVILLTVLSLSVAQAQTSTPEQSTPSSGFAWSSIPDREQDTISNLLASDHWPLRVFALLRLERFSGVEV